MDITFNCEKCGQHLTIDAAGAGLVVNCPSCKVSLKVPNQSTPKAAPRPVVAVVTAPPIRANSTTNTTNQATLFNCSACGKQISSEADSCPNCGQPNKSKKITCPNCKSQNISKIGMGSKIGAVALVGVFAMGRITKTWECKDCKYKW